MGYITNLDDDYVVPSFKDTCHLVFSRNLREVLDSKGWDAKTLAIKSGICESNVSRYLSGKRLPSLKTFQKIVCVIECTYDDLLKD